jgi:hypothetical protein
MQKQVKDLAIGDRLPNYGIVKQVQPGNPWVRVIFETAHAQWPPSVQQWDPEALVDVELPPEELPSEKAKGLYLLLDGCGRTPKGGSGRYHRTLDEALVEAHHLAEASDDHATITILKQVAIVWVEMEPVVKREDLS